MLTADDKPDKTDSGAVHWIGHHSHRLVLTILSVRLVDSVLTLFLPALSENFVMNLGRLASTVAMFTILACWFRHDSKFCGDCLLDSPADGARRAERKSKSLRQVHRWMDVAVHNLLATFVVLIAAFVVLPGLFATLDLTLAQAVWQIAFLLFAIRVEVVAQRHRVLRPWCPWCKGPDDPGPVDVPNPDPAMTKTG